MSVIRAAVALPLLLAGCGGAALRALWVRQAGRAAHSRLGLHGQGCVVVAVEVGVPVHPQWISDEFDRLLVRADLPMASHVHIDDPAAGAVALGKVYRTASQRTTCERR